MTKAEHIAYWLDTAAFDWPPVQRMMAAGDFVHGLFFARLVIKKLSTAHWAQANQAEAETIPPRKVPIAKLWQNASLVPNAAQLATVAELSGYDDNKLYPTPGLPRVSITAAAATRLLAKTSALRAWLLSTLPPATP